MSDASVFVHPAAEVEAGAVVGSGTKIWRHCHVMRGAEIGADCVLGQGVFVAGSVRIGRGCRIQNNVSLYDGVLLGDDVFVGPSAVFTNVTRPRAAFPRRDRYENTYVGSGVSIGANATIICGVRLGEGAFIAAGAVVTHSVAPFVLVAGVPARPLGFVCRCGEKLGPPLSCASCGREYSRDFDGLRQNAGV
ncbi:MAG: N-acetyltransferase [Planctomycetes bacterium]|nr:N-acetyltransferase [Planctomycetota bacterium]